MLQNYLNSINLIFIKQGPRQQYQIPLLHQKNKAVLESEKVILWILFFSKFQPLSEVNFSYNNFSCLNEIKLLSKNITFLRE